jgi:3-polyprenyl-4-hydroxybenzoate decarboxylase
MFIRENDEVEIKIYCKKIRTRYAALTEKEFKAIPELEKPKYELLTIMMREMTWGTFNKLHEDALEDAPGGEQKFNYRLYKESKLKALIKSWSAKDKEGKIIPVSENMIAHLAPSVAECIIKAYDEVSLLNEEEEGK